MQPRLSVITLAVDDLERAVRFYRDGLGLPTKGIVGREVEHGAVAFFELHAGLRLALFARADLAREAGVGAGPRSATEGALSHNVGRRDEVDEVLREAERAGAIILRPARATAWGGYAGWFRDPDGHLWEIAWNPARTLPD